MRRVLTKSQYDDRAWKKFAYEKMRMYKLLHKIGNAIRKKKTAELRAARGKTKDRIFYKVNKDAEYLYIIQRSPAYGFFKYANMPIAKLWLIEETASDDALAAELTRQWFAPRPRRRR